MLGRSGWGGSKAGSQSPLNLLHSQPSPSATHTAAPSSLLGLHPHPISSLALPLMYPHLPLPWGGYSSQWSPGDCPASSPVFLFHPSLPHPSSAARGPFKATSLHAIPWLQTHRELPVRGAEGRSHGSAGALKTSCRLATLYSWDPCISYSGLRTPTNQRPCCSQLILTSGSLSPPEE